MTNDNESKRRDIRTEPWFPNVPEWLGEVLAQLTENRDSNADMLRQLLENTGGTARVIERLEAMEMRLENQATVLSEKQEALVKAVVDLKEFANSLYGPQSAFTQINTKLDSIRTLMDQDRQANEKRFLKLEEAQEETDDRMKEFEETLDRFRLRLDQIAQQSAD